MLTEFKQNISSLKKMINIRKISSVLLYVGIFAAIIAQYESAKIKRAHRKRALTQQQKLDESLNQQLIKYEQFLKEQQANLEMQKQEQLRQLQELQVQLFQTQQKQESFIAEYQANLNNQKIAQLNQNRPPGPTIAELEANKPVIAKDAALGGATSNSRRKIEHDHKLEQQLRFEETKKQILAQQQLQIDAMNTQNQIQAETRNDQQEAFINAKIDIENQQIQQRQQLYDLIEGQIRERKENALKLQEFIDNAEYENDEVLEKVGLNNENEEVVKSKFGRLVQADPDERDAALKLLAAKRQEKYLRIQQERLLRRKEEQIRQAQKLQDILHETQKNQETYEKNYQENLQDAKQEQLRQSKVIQEALHQTQRELEAEHLNQNGVLIEKYNDLAVDQQTRQQKMIIQQHQERIRLQNKIQQNHRLTQDMNHEDTKADIQLQQAQQKDHLINQHEIQNNERLRQRQALEMLRNEIRSQIQKQKSIVQEEQAEEERSDAEVINPETVYLEPRFFLPEAQSVEPLVLNNKKDSFLQPDTKIVTITTVEEPALKTEIIETTVEAPMNKTVKLTCENKKDGMYRNENECTSYYVCTEGQLYKFACPSGTSFNMEHCTCDWPTDSTECVVPLLTNECVRNQQQSEILIKSETLPEANQEQSRENEVFSCENKEKGFYRDPLDCTKFYYCEVFNKPAPLQGQTIIKNDFYCPNNFHFDVFTCKCGAATANSCSDYALTTFCTHSS